MWDATPDIRYMPSTRPCFSMNRIHWRTTAGTGKKKEPERGKCPRRRHVKHQPHHLPVCTAGS